MNKMTAKIKEYIYDDVMKVYLTVWRLDGRFTFEEEKNNALNVKKYWLLKYFILWHIKRKLNLSHSRIRKFLEYEPPKYHCF